MANPAPKTVDFDGIAFLPIKKQIKASLHQDQRGLCVYCEILHAPDDGQIDHIKPKSGPNAHPHLVFSYTNLAHSCINNKTCGQKKKAGLLPIGPGPGCNDQFMLSTVGVILPRPDLSRKARHPVMQTLQMLGLESTQSPRLVEERKKWIDTVVAHPQRKPATAFRISCRYTF